ncbi:PAS domain-containing protein [bacterium]|nr:PAS domain-containing protein [bacterium]MBU1883562.1 PAS domain-containing protein [bacterium]
MKIHNYNPYNKTIGFSEKFLNADDLIVSKTDILGNIKYANSTMLRISGTDLEELLGKNHNISRHPDMPRAIYKMMWDTIEDGKDFYCYIKNLGRDGSFYWVFAFITPDFDKDGNIIGYNSERRAPNPKAIVEISSIYQKLREKEILLGVDEAVLWFKESVLKSKTYHKYIHRLQNELN